jgi:hypothetical protein
MLLSELLPRHLRGQGLFTHTLAMLLGFLLSAVANQALNPHPWGWRVSSGLLAAPAVVLVALLPFVGESPQVLCQRGDAKAARAVSGRGPRGAAKASGSEGASFALPEHRSCGSRRPVLFPHPYRRPAPRGPWQVLAAARPPGADVDHEMAQIAAAAARAARPAPAAAAPAPGSAAAARAAAARRRRSLLAHPPVLAASVLYPLTLMLTGLSALSGWTPNLLLAMGASGRLAYAGNTLMMAVGLGAATVGERAGREGLGFPGRGQVWAGGDGLCHLPPRPMLSVRPPLPGLSPQPRCLSTASAAACCWRWAAPSSCRRSRC